MQRPDVKFAFDDIDLPARAGDLALKVFQCADIVERLVCLLSGELPSDFGVLFALYFELLQQAAARCAWAAIPTLLHAIPAHPALSILHVPPKRRRL